MHLLAWLYAPKTIDISGSLGFFISAVPKGVQVLHPLSPYTKTLGFLVGAIPMIMIECILYFLIRLFKLYENAEIFLVQNVSYIKKIGYALLITQIVSILSDGLLSVIVTLNNPNGFRSLTLTVSGENISLALTAFMIILISWIMAEGCRLREEQQLTI